jgi:mono/diheme cytochrome c family protein
MEDYPVRRLKILFLISSLACLALLSMAAFEENFTAGWRDPQIKFAAMLAEQARAAGHDGESSAAYPIELRQVFLKDLNRVDRCVSCHTGIDNPAFQSAEQPLTTHPGNLLESHPVDRFGCTICHEGQGRATNKAEAHGRVPFWDEPLLVGDLVQSRCAKCHHESEVPEAPVLSRGQHLVSALGCAGCHQVGQSTSVTKVGPPLPVIGSKVTRKWLGSWLTNPKSYLPNTKMPRYDLSAEAVDSLAAYLMTQRDSAIDASPEPAGDTATGTSIFREAQCIVCHVTKEDAHGNPVGGVLGPDLRKISNKANPRWLVAFLKNPHAFTPDTKMPRYDFNDQQAADLATFMLEEWVDLDLKDKEAEQPTPPPATPERIQQGQLLFKELGCAGCHDLSSNDAKLAGPDLVRIGTKPVHELDFGNTHIRRSTPDFLYTKLKTPKAFRRDMQLPTWQKPVEAIWQNLRPSALFADVATLPEGSEAQQLAWILARAQGAGILAADLKLPESPPLSQAEWLTRNLNAIGALSPLKMPTFDLSDEDVEAVTIALMGRGEPTALPKQYDVAQTPTISFAPQDSFGVLERRYRCLSCHSIRGSGVRQASDLTYEGSRVNREWLAHYLIMPYSMRRTLTIAMPIFHFAQADSQLMAEYMSLVFVDTRLDEEWQRDKDRADVQRGQALFDAKGCIACHQLNGKGGDVGPSLTTQVPEFPQGTWVGDKLKPGWIYKWLRSPQSLVPDTLEPNLGLTEQEALDVTAFILALKNPEFQDKK